MSCVCWPTHCAILQSRHHITEQTKAFLGDDYKYEVVRKVDDPVIQEMRLKTFLIVPGGSSVKRAHKNAATRNLNVARVTTYDGQRATPPSKRSSLSQGTATKVSMSYKTGPARNEFFSASTKKNVKTGVCPIL